MELTGHIHNGVVVFDGGTIPPEGTRVTVATVLATPPTPVPYDGLRPQVPLVHTGKPGTLHLTNDMIAEIFAQDDIEYMKGMFNAPS